MTAANGRHVSTYRQNCLAEYWQALFRARYYVTQARDRQALAGGDPVTGQSRSRGPHGALRGEQFRGEGVVAYKAMARFWIGEAKRLRLAGFRFQ